MPNITETLEQTERWYGQDSFPYRVNTMDTSHITNVLEWLSRRASQLRLQRYWNEFLEYSDIDDSEVGPNTEAAFIKWLGSGPAIEEDASAWLARRPLVQALNRELRRRGTTDGDVISVRYDKELASDAD